MGYEKHEAWMKSLAVMDKAMIDLGKAMQVPPRPKCTCGHHLQTDGTCVVCMREPELCQCEFGKGPPAESLDHSFCCKRIEG
jgi:hypothetical protein